MGFIPASLPHTRRIGGLYPRQPAAYTPNRRCSGGVYPMPVRLKN
ncbi:hypothetical protein D1AOALGA4SA_7780 [Olavius algarvensis Delta 1 endosymbiont]|nr:hypothetical protein D1AOALGA4SA_7780 [Olavius algarvensis Delta 1 endosymbiont]